MPMCLPTHDTSRKSAPSSANASRRSSMALDSVEKASTPKKRPIRAFLRRLSSFSSKNDNKDKEAIKQNSAKANFPDAATMPVVDVAMLKQLSEAGESNKGDIASVSSGTRKNEANENDERDAVVESGLAPKLEGLDLSKASPAPVNEEMAKNGFGTRSAYTISSTTSNDSKSAIELQEKDVSEPQEKDTVQPVEKKEDDHTPTAPIIEDEGKSEVDVWASTRPAQIARTDSQTPSSEDSFFLGSGHSTLSRPGSGALMKHGSESAISEELYTPDPSTAHLPTAKTDAEAMMVGNVTAAAKVVAEKEGEGPVVTAVPAVNDEQHVEVV